MWRTQVIRQRNQLTDWRTDEDAAADERDRPYLIAEAWAYGALIVAVLLLAIWATFSPRS